MHFVGRASISFNTIAFILALKCKYTHVKQLLLCLALLAFHIGYGQTISTIAGTGASAYSGDGAGAVSAALSGPFAVAADNKGNIFVADRLNHRIRKIDRSGIISTVAGNGTAGFSGDGGPATLAMIDGPTGVAADTAGNLFIADKNNNRIRRVSNGMITTIAGTGTAAYSGDGGPASAAAINGPRSVATDKRGNVFIADQSNNRIRKIDAAGIIKTIAGNGSQGFSGDGGPATNAQLYNPAGLAAGANGELCIADVDNERVRRVAADGTITTVAGTGTSGFSGDYNAATGAQLYEPIGLATDKLGNVYLADAWNQRIRMITVSGSIFTIAGNGAAGFSGDAGLAINAAFNNPYGIAVESSGVIYVADYTNNRIRKISAVTAVEDVSSGVQFSVYPNPSKGHIAIDMPQTMAEGRVVITTMNGVVVSSFPVVPKQVREIDFPGGLYIISVFDGGVLLSKKELIVIQR